MFGHPLILIPSGLYSITLVANYFSFIRFVCAAHPSVENLKVKIDRLVGLKVSIQTADHDVAGSIPGTYTILNVDYVWNGLYPAS